MLYFISDTHFSDPNILLYSRPQFKNVEEMDKYIIKNWNETVKPDDTVYHLGDVGNYELLNQLNGNIMVILGNHDDEIVLKHTCPQIRVYDKSIIDKYYLLSHKPIVFIPKEFPMLNIHGHLHQYDYVLGDCKTWYEGNRYFNVSCEKINFTPISEKDIMNKLGYIKT